MDLGTVLLMGALAYGLGLFWYGMVLGRTQDSVVRTAAYPFLAIVFGQAYLQLGPQVGHLYLVGALIAALVGVLVDWAVGMIRGMVDAPRAQTAAAAH
jgi:drug/metabolite transporter (DMT)-like permease